MSNEIKTIGIDLGNANVKTSEGVIFESKTKSSITNMNDSDIKVNIGGTDYTVGSVDGATNIRKDKHKKKHYKICLLTAIAKSFKAENINCNVVVGVPVEVFNDKDLVGNIKETINSYETEEIVINDVSKKVAINNVEVFAESAIVFSNPAKFKNEKTLVLDFGGSTVDVSFWNGLRQESSRTYKQGMISLYENIIKAVNDKFGTKLNSAVAKDMIGKDSFKIEQTERDIAFIRNTIEDYVDGLTSTINQYFNVEEADSIQLIGGGAVQLFTYLKEEYDKAELTNNATFANANNYKKVGENIWK